MKYQYLESQNLQSCQRRLREREARRDANFLPFSDTTAQFLVSAATSLLYILRYYITQSSLTTYTSVVETSAQSSVKSGEDSAPAQ